MDLLSTLGQLFGTFGVDWHRLIGQLITFVILLVGLRFILYKPMLTMLENRKAKIAQGLKDAEEAAKARSAAEAAATEALKQANAKAQQLLEEAQKTSEQLRQQIMADTQAEIARNRQVQQDMLDQMRQEMLRDVRSEVASLVVATTEKVLRQDLSKDQQQKLADRAAKELK